MRIDRQPFASRLGKVLAALALLVGLSALTGAGQDKKAIDWDRAKQLHARFQKGEKLTPEEQAYLERAREELKKRQKDEAGEARGGKDSVGLTPLTDLGQGTYKGESGGLYGEGHNEPPAAHQAAARKETAKILPLDAQGKPSPDGEIVLLSIGMSNTTQEFSAFKQLADRDADKSRHVVIVDGAQGGQAAEQWTDPKGERSQAGERVWATADARLKAAGVTPQQVQVLWIKQALIQQGRFREFPAHAHKLEADLVKILQFAKERYANVRLAYLSSRIYAGYATTQLNPEPYAYEGAFSVRWVIQAQIKGDPKLNYDPQRGPVTAPLVLWGPYLWADGQTPRKSDGLVWKRQDLVARDGTHPSDSGRRKVANLLLKFFKTDPLARTWFVKEATAGK
jgi:hypothetical protein